MNIYFVTDIHGSDVCFRKLLNAPTFYGCSVLILGGDITGKIIIPILNQEDGTYLSDFQGKRELIKGEENLNQFNKKVKHGGLYPVLMERKDYERAQTDKKYIDCIFEETMLKSIRDWLELAKQRLSGSKTKLYISAGNDDLLSMDRVFEDLNSKNVFYVEEQIVELEGGHELLSFGSSNETPWHTEREISEEVLYPRLKKLANELRNPDKAILSIHVPPIGLGLDVCPDLDAEFRPIVKNGDVVMKAAGSHSVKKVLEETKPLLGLHGHIHESSGISKIGRTVCINPGSEYGQGVLRGALVSLKDGKIKNHSLTRG